MFFVPFIQEYYAEMPEFGIDERRIDDMYAVAAAHYRLGEERQAGETLVRVVNPATATATDGVLRTRC